MSVKVRRERPDQRSRHRVSSSLFVDYDARQLRASNWKLGGVNFNDPGGNLPDVGNELDFSKEFASRGVEIKFKITLEVPRCDPEKYMISQYSTEIGERAQELLQEFMRTCPLCGAWHRRYNSMR